LDHNKKYEIEPLVGNNIRDEILSEKTSLKSLSRKYNVSKNHFTCKHKKYDRIDTLSPIEVSMIVKLMRLTKLPPEELVEPLRNYIPNITHENLHQCQSLIKFCVCANKE
jgi:hypothetical protein